MFTNLVLKVKNSSLVALIVTLVLSVVAVSAQTSVDPQDLLNPDPLSEHWGQTARGNGVGISLQSNDNIAISGRALGPAGAGVRGYATDPTGTAYGVLGRTDSVSGIGVYAYSSANSGTPYALKAKAFGGYGVFGESVNNVGVYGASTNHWSGWFNNGVRISDSPWHGIQIDGAGWSGVWVNTANNDGFLVNSAGGQGLRVVNANQNGVLVENAKADGVLGISSGSASVGGVHGYSTGTYHYGVLGQDGSGNDAGYGVVTTHFDGQGSDMKTSDDLYVDDVCTGCSLAYLAVNGGEDVLQPGDLVAIHSLQPAARELSGERPLLVVGKPGEIQANSLLLGVVLEGVPPKADSGLENNGTSETSIPGGGYLAVAVRGSLVQLKAGNAGGPIEVGDGLAASPDSNLAVKAQKVDLGGVQSYVPGSLLAVALEPLQDSSGLIWVLLTY